jgi:aspartate-semialdehyde dehydrogenase
MAPERLIHVMDDEYGPQPWVHGSYPDMVTLVGRLRENKLFRNGLSYVLTSDNLERGAGRGAMLIAELQRKDMSSSQVQAQFFYSYQLQGS